MVRESEKKYWSFEICEVVAFMGKESQQVVGQFASNVSRFGSASRNVFRFSFFKARIHDLNSDMSEICI